MWAATCAQRCAEHGALVDECALKLDAAPKPGQPSAVPAGAVAVYGPGLAPLEVARLTGLPRASSNWPTHSSLPFYRSRDPSTASIDNDVLDLTAPGTGYLGNDEGEEGGPILAWRDPFVFVHEDESVSLLWAAKISALRGAVARAKLKKVGDSYELDELMPAVAMPDKETFTQLECPKVVFDKDSQTYYLLISVCNRIDESQPESEVGKGINVYKSKSIDGPWESCGPRILGDRNLFGPTVLKTDFENDRLLCIAPYTEVAGPIKALTFAPVFYIYLNPLRVDYLD